MELKKTFLFLILCMTFLSCSNSGLKNGNDSGSDGALSEQNDETYDESGTDCRKDELSERIFPLFKNVTESAGLGKETTGFGRASVVDINGDGFDDIVATPAHDGEHPTPPGDYDKLVIMLTAEKSFKDITEQTELSKVKTGLLLFGDIDNDGDQDIYAGIIAGTTPQSGEGINLNNGKGLFNFVKNNGTKVLSQIGRAHV